jgi:hypothetical protein
MNVIKTSRAISRVNVELKTNVSETSSVSIIRVRDTEFGTPDRLKGFSKVQIILTHFLEQDPS